MKRILNRKKNSMPAKRVRFVARLFLLSALAFSLFALGCCKRKASLEEAGKAYQSGDFNKAAEIFLPEAEKGSPEAQVNVAFMYYCGMHFPKDHKKAAEWYGKAARRGNVNAQFSLGTLHENGEGVPRNLEEAYFWYAIAESKGDKDAQRLRRDLEQRLNAAQVKSLKKRIAAWKPES